MNPWCRLDTTTTTTTTFPPTSTSASTTTTGPGVTVPAVIGLKIAAARAALRAAGLPPVGLNLACNRGTLASQSVVTSLSVAGKPPDARVGAVPLNPGATVPPGTRVGVTWSGCYGNGSPVPAIVGLTHAPARHALRAVGLAWACYSVGRSTTTTTTTVKPVKPPETVLTQNPGPGAVLKPGSIVSFTMQACPQ
jgi:beta-lactam-binding protein with PASTA domain